MIILDAFLLEFGAFFRREFVIFAFRASLKEMEHAIDALIRFLGVERGFSENYQLSTERSLTDFAQWCAAKKSIDDPRKVTLALMSEYLADRKRAGLSASSIKLIVVALKIFFRFLAAKAS